MKRILRLSNIIPLTLVLFISKSFVVEPSAFDFGIIALMSLLFLYKLSIDKQITEDKDAIIKKVADYQESTLSKIAQFEEQYKKDFKEIGYIQDANRKEIESKLSTLNLALQPRATKQPNGKPAYNWG